MFERISKALINKRGFTLVEVVVATAIVAIVSVMLVYAFVGAAGVNKRANEIREAGRGFDNDIHTNVDNRNAVANLTLKVTKSSSGDPLQINGTTPGNEIDFRLPMDVYTFTGGNSGNRQMLIFRSPEDTSTP